MGIFKKKKGRTERNGFKKKILNPKKAARVKKRSGAAKPSQKKKNFLLGVVLLWALLFGTSVYVLLFSPALLVTEIRVEGGDETINRKVETELRQELSEEYFSFLPKANYFFVSERSLEARLATTFPLLRSITLTTRFPDILEVRIALREKSVLWCSSGPCYILTEEGEARESRSVFESEENLKQSIFVTDRSGQPVRTGQRIFDFDFATFVAQLAPRFEGRLGIPLTDESSAASRFAIEIRVRTTEGWEVYINTRVPLEESLDTLSLLFEKEITSEQIGEIVMKHLKKFDKVAYIRFASIYRAFEDVETFQHELKTLTKRRQKNEGTV